MSEPNSELDTALLGDQEQDGEERPAPRPKAPPRVPLWRGSGAEDDVVRPRAPESLNDIGLSPVFLEDLILKTLYARGATTGDELSEAIKLPFWALDDTLASFQRQKLAHVIRSGGVRRGATFELTTEGRRRAREIFESSPYLGPAPVHIDRYHYWVRRQSVRRMQIGPARVKEAFSHLVLDPTVVEVMGPAVNAGRSVFIYGEPGNGKSTIAESVVKIFGDSVYLPYAVYSDGDVIQLYDPITHEMVEDGADDEEEPLVYPPPSHDKRFVRAKRPLVIVGGELTLEQLELNFDPHSGCYYAPPQMKANNGVFVIDDLGRQRVPPRDLLNRWMIPLDRGLDYLTFRSGRRVPIPFGCLVLFATNLDPSDLVEEAFLRRIRYKVHLGDPDKAGFAEIFRRACERNDVTYDSRAVDWIFQKYYDANTIKPRSCHAVDLVSHLLDLSNFLGTRPALTPDLVARVSSAYFTGMQIDGARHNGDR
jgi:predicted ATPase with chaperone activity